MGFAGSAIVAVAAAVSAERNSSQASPESPRRPLLQNDPAVQKLLQRVAEFGFPQAHVEESLRDAVLNHATATFCLLAHQAVRRKAGAGNAAPTRALSPAAPDDSEFHCANRAN